MKQPVADRHEDAMNLSTDMQSTLSASLRSSAASSASNSSDGEGGIQGQRTVCASDFNAEESTPAPEILNDPARAVCNPPQLSFYNNPRASASNLNRLASMSSGTSGRLSIQSASTAARSGSKAASDSDAAGWSVDDSQAVRSNIPRHALNSLSLLAPRAHSEVVEVKKRLKGGFADTVDGMIGCAVYYPTPQERRLAREHELQHEARSRQVLCPGRGLLWSHPSVQEGLPCPLEALEAVYNVANDGGGETLSKGKDWTADPKTRGRTLQFLLSLQQYLPELVRQLSDPDRLHSETVLDAIDLTQEFVSASHRDTCRHPRIRILLTQLLVQLTDTLVMLDEPLRFAHGQREMCEAELSNSTPAVAAQSGDLARHSSQISSNPLNRPAPEQLLDTLKYRQANLLQYVLLMIDNCIAVATTEVRRLRQR